MKSLPDFKKDMRVLLLYPNLSMSFALPHSIAVLSSCLKERGCEVDLFDTTLYKPSGKSDDDLRVELGQFPHVDVPGVKTSDMYKDFQEKVDGFCPDVVMVSLVDNTVDLGLDLMHCLDEHIFTVVGGVSVVCDPVRFYDNPFFDFVWEGSAEDLILGKGNNIKYEDYTVFEEERFYRPWSGKLFKTIPLHTSRFCPYSCGFCCAKRVRERFGYSPVNIDRVIDELVFQIELHDPEFIHITSESFLAMNLKNLRKFADAYQRFNLPFWCQSHIRDITEEKIKILKEINCFKIALGIECGNEEYRRVMVNKFFSNDDAKRAVDILGCYDIRVGLNSIIGLPFETKDLIWDTIRLNQELNSILVSYGCPEAQVNCYIFQPYYGTELRSFCEKHNLLRSSNVGVVNQGDIVVDNPFVNDDELRFIELNFGCWVKDLVEHPCCLKVEV